MKVEENKWTLSIVETKVYNCVYQLIPTKTHVMVPHAQKNNYTAHKAGCQVQSAISNQRQLLPAVASRC